MSDALPPPKRFSPPTPGQTVFDENGNPFTIGHFLKAGAFSDVYECTDFWGNRLAAKVLKPAGTYSQVESRAIAEADKLYSLRHPCVTHVHGAFEYNDTFYLITERCDSDLNDFLKNSPNQGIWLRYVAPRVLQALSYMHAQSVTHCDLHRGNVFALFNRDAVIPDEQQALTFKVGDFGISKLLHELDAPAPTFKKSIRPPECIDSAHGYPDFRVDVYQAAILFLEMTLGKELDFSPDQILAGHPRQLAEGLNTHLGEVLAKALRRTVVQRTVSARQFWLELRDII